MPDGHCYGAVKRKKDTQASVGIAAKYLLHKIYQAKKYSVKL